MRTLELKDICGYLPHELHCLNCDGMVEMIDYDNIGNLVRGIELQDDAEDDEWVANQQYKPILRPLSVLYRTITHNGKEIIPIVECAKIHDDKTDWTCDLGECALRLAYDKKEPQIWFDFSQNGFHTGFDSYGVVFVNNQFQLFDYLHELKIDCHGFIESGLAIDCNTLEYNHYK
jgi:hypothetical protein